jgi:hypothetical protein
MVELKKRGSNLIFNATSPDIFLMAADMARVFSGVAVSWQSFVYLTVPF